MVLSKETARALPFELKMALWRMGSGNEVGAIVSCWEGRAEDGTEGIVDGVSGAA